MRAPPVLLVTLLATVGSACGDQVNCENLCLHTLPCEVTFAPLDDLEGDKIASGERSDAESCALGCADNSAITVEGALCVDEVTAADRDPSTCNANVLECLGAELVSAG